MVIFSCLSNFFLVTLGRPGSLTETYPGHILLFDQLLLGNTRWTLSLSETYFDHVLFVLATISWKY